MNTKLKLIFTFTSILLMSSTDIVFSDTGNSAISNYNEETNIIGIWMNSVKEDNSYLDSKIQLMIEKNIELELKVKILEEKLKEESTKKDYDSDYIDNLKTNVELNKSLVEQLRSDQQFLIYMGTLLLGIATYFGYGKLTDIKKSKEQIDSIKADSDRIYGFIQQKANESKEHVETTSGYLKEIAELKKEISSFNESKAENISDIFKKMDDHTAFMGKFLNIYCNDETIRDGLQNDQLNDLLNSWDELNQKYHIEESQNSITRRVENVDKLEEDVFRKTEDMEFVDEDIDDTEDIDDLMTTDKVDEDDNYE